MSLRTEYETARKELAYAQGVAVGATEVADDMRALAERFQERAVKAEALLEEARLALEPFGPKRLATPDDFTRARRISAKIEAAQRPASEVTK